MDFVKILCQRLLDIWKVLARFNLDQVGRVWMIYFSTKLDAVTNIHIFLRKTMSAYSTCVRFLVWEQIRNQYEIIPNYFSNRLLMHLFALWCLLMLSHVEGFILIQLPLWPRLIILVKLVTNCFLYWLILRTLFRVLRTYNRL